MGDHGFAAGLDGAGTNEQPQLPEVGVAHALAVYLEVGDPFLDLGHLSVRHLQIPGCLDQVVDVAPFQVMKASGHPVAGVVARDGESLSPQGVDVLSGVLCRYRHKV